MKTRLKINGIIMFCVFVLVVFFPGVFFREGKAGFWNEISTVFGIALILLGQMFRASGRGYKSEHSNNGHSLVEGGPYTLVRNPMYLGIILISVGVILALFRLWAVFIFLLFFVIRYQRLIFREERELLRTFPDDYAAYLRRVPRLLPSLRVLLRKDIAAYLPLKSAWISKEIGSILAVLLPVLFLKLWVGIRNQGAMRAYLHEAAYMLAVILFFLAMAVYLCRRTGKVDQKCCK